MTPYSDLSNGSKTILVILFLLLNLGQFAELIILFHYGDRTRGRRVLLWCLLTFFLLPQLGAEVYREKGLFSQVPAVLLLLGWALAAGIVAAGAAAEIKKGRHLLTGQSIKYAADMLPSGLCYFEHHGYLIQCNARMQELFFRMTGRDLQMQKELEQALGPKERDPKTGLIKPRVSRFADGTAWSFHTTEVRLSEKQRFVQYRATDVTELLQVQAEIDQRNGELATMIRQVKKITENVADITRQQEILTAKMRVHNKMGNCLLAARQYLLQKSRDPAEKRQELLQIWRESMEELQSEVGAKDDTDAYEMVVRIARSIGLEIQRIGELPEDPEKSYLLVVALRECVTNALHHAGADCLTLEITESGEEFQAVYKNNGEVPSQEIVEGGGLKSLRERIQGAGGRMQVKSKPEFSLTIGLPK